MTRRVRVEKPLMWDMFGVVVCKSVRVSAHCKLLHPHGFEDRVPRKVLRNSMVNHYLPQNSHKLGDHRPFHCWLNCIPIPFPNFGVSCRCMSVHLQLVSKILALGRRLGRTSLLSIAVGRYANLPCPATRWLGRGTAESRADCPVAHGVARHGTTCDSPARNGDPLGKIAAHPQDI